MPLSPNDYRELIQHLSDQLVDAGLGAIHQESLETAAFAAGPAASARTFALAYVEAVADALSRRSAHTYRAALEGIRHFIRTPNGEPITDIELLAAPRDETLLRR